MFYSTTEDPNSPNHPHAILLTITSLLEDSILQFDHQGLNFIGQPRPLVRPVPVILILQLHVKLPEDLAEDESSLGEKKPS